jgi:hypothetical protein
MRDRTHPSITSADCPSAGIERLARPALTSRAEPPTGLPNFREPRGATGG